ncbi:hypothetical protein EDB19DRAFT_1831115 [Suillus lakei]|nr:hypothetical protein EDB19DRAFT_1831115 [Suillus lakei]
MIECVASEMKQLIAMCSEGSVALFEKKNHTIFLNQGLAELTANHVALAKATQASEKFFNGLHTIINEYSEIMSMVVTQNKGHNQIGPVLYAMATAAKMFDYTPTKAIYTDSV